MLAEHLIEPEFLIEIAETRRNYKDFIREFSRQSPRVISEFPKFKKFRSKTLKGQAIGASEGAKNRLVELLQFIVDGGLVSRKTEFVPELSYVENFAKADQECVVDFLLLDPKTCCDGLNTKIITINDFNEGIESIPNQKLVAKSIERMNDAVASFLRLSSNITFVDPYFSYREEMWQPMISFLNNALESSPTLQKNIQILFSGDNQKSPTSQFLLSKMNEENTETIELLDSFKVIAIGEKDGGEKIHNRYMISELGAFIWGIGLDENNSEVIDDVILLNDELYAKRFEQYAELTGFDVINYAE